MREDWKRVRLNEFVWFQRGYDLPKTKFKKGNVPVYGSTSILGYHNIAKVKAPGIITGRSGTLGVMQYAQEDFWPHNTSLWVKDFKGNYERFAYYLLQCLDFGLFNSGGAVPTLNRNTLNAFIIDLPPLPTQRKIASILSAYDELIENNLKRIQLLEEQAQLTYEEWFVRLKFPGHENTAINKETGLPDGWEKVKLGDILKRVQTTKKIKTSEILEEGNIPVVDQSRDFIRGYTNDKDSLLDYNVPLIVFGDHTRIVKFINFPFARGADGTQIILSKESKMPQHLFYYVIKNIDLSDYHYSRHFKYLKDFDINIPKLHQSNNYEHIVAKKFQLIKSLRDQNQLLKEARDILLPRLMMGLIDVDELDVEINDYVLPENN